MQTQKQDVGSHRPSDAGEGRHGKSAIARFLSPRLVLVLMLWGVGENIPVIILILTEII